MSQLVAVAAPEEESLKNLAGFLDILVQIDLANRDKSSINDTKSSYNNIVKE